MRRRTWSAIVALLTASLLLPSAGYAAGYGRSGGHGGGYSGGSSRGGSGYYGGSGYNRSIYHGGGYRGGGAYYSNGYHGGNYHGGYYSGHYYQNDWYGWYGAAALMGGIALGTVLASPWYARYPVYVDQGPQVIYSEPVVVNQAYAYPEPGIPTAPQAQAAAPPPGQWVEVPGQWVQGRWVPQHKAWVPDTP